MTSRMKRIAVNVVKQVSSKHFTGGKKTLATEPLSLEKKMEELQRKLVSFPLTNEHLQTEVKSLKFRFN